MAFVLMKNYGRIANNFRPILNGYGKRNPSEMLIPVYESA
jgi:hypothetical protein